jgi:hypothetical protein
MRLICKGDHLASPKITKILTMSFAESWSRPVDLVLVIIQPIPYLIAARGRNLNKLHPVVVTNDPLAHLQSKNEHHEKTILLHYPSCGFLFCTFLCKLSVRSESQQDLQDAHV